MAFTTNEVKLIGRAGKDAELKYIPSGKAVVKFSLATGGGKNKSTGKEYQTDWHNIVSWSESAADVRKGDEVEVKGRISYRSWEQNGEKKYMTEIVANSVTRVGKEKPAPAKPITPEYGTEIDDSEIPF